jgi:hypothetical protein
MSQIPLAPVQIELTAAIDKLRALGFTVDGCDMPGLLVVNGRELTIMQTIDLASQQK